MSIDQAKRDKLKKIFNEVLLNQEAQEKWLEQVDPAFLECLETIVRLYNPQTPKEQWLRTGVMLGAVYEQWRQRNVASHT